VAAAGAGDEVEARVELGEPRGEEGGVCPLALCAAHPRDDVASVMKEPSMVVPGHHGGL